MSHAQESRPGTTSRRRKVLRRSAFAVVVLAGLLYVAGYAFASDRLPGDATVAGVDVGGMRPERAERELRDRLGQRADDPVRVRAGKRELVIDPQKAGLSVDVPASVAQVPVGRSWNPVDMWQALTGGGDHPAVVQRDGDELTKQLRRFARQVGTKAVKGSVDFRASGPEPTYPRPGARLDVERAEDAVLAAYPADPADDEPVELELEEVRPDVTRADVDRFVDEVAEPAMSGPVVFEISGEELSLTPEEFAPALRGSPQDGRLELEADVRRLRDALRPQLRGVTRAARDATFRIAGGRPRVVPARDGVTVENRPLVGAFLEMVESPDEADRRQEVATSAAEPDRTTQEARSLGVREKVSEFTTYYPHADYRNVNIGRGAELIDGTVLEPGDVFSLNETVGERTRENGFTAGTIISEGVFKEDLGGGVSQVATTTFNAMFFAGLEDVEHKPHSFYIDRYPVGREATVAWPTVDLRFRNDTDHGVFITTVHQPSSYAGQGALTVRMWSTKVWDITARTGERYAYTAPETRYLSGEDCIPNSGYSGFTIDVVRVFRRAGEQAIHHTERFRTTYTPSDTVVCQ